MTKDMTEGNPLRLLINFSIPLLLGTLFQQLYNLVDTVIVGKYLGLHALSSVGSTIAIIYLVTGFCIGICNGFAIPVAQMFGAKDYKTMRMYVTNGAYLAIGFSVIITAVVVFFCRDILVIMRMPEEIFEQTYAYLVVIYAGVPFVFLYNLTAGIIRALGDSKTPFYFLMASTALNIILDLVFILKLGMNVEGAAYATVISQALAGLLCLIYMKKKYEILQMEAGEKSVSGIRMYELCKSGIPLGLLSCITGIGSVMLQSAVNALGMVYVAAYTAVSKLQQFTLTPYIAMDSSIATFTSQNYGAGKVDRIKAGIKAGLLVYGSLSVVMILALVLAGDKIALVFVDASETEVLEMVGLFFKCSAPFYVIVSVLDTYRSVIQGLGYSSASMAAGVCELIVRAVMATVVIPAVGYLGVCFTDAVAWVAGMVCVVVMYYAIMKKLRKKNGGG